eukprot:gene7223-biopygen22516
MSRQVGPGQTTCSRRFLQGTVGIVRSADVQSQICARVNKVTCSRRKREMTHSMQVMSRQGEQGDVQSQKTRNDALLIPLRAEHSGLVDAQDRNRHHAARCRPLRRPLPLKNTAQSDA